MCQMPGLEQAEVRNLSWHPRGLAGTQSLKLPPLPARVCISRSWSWGWNPEYLDVGS